MNVPLDCITVMRMPVVITKKAVLSARVNLHTLNTEMVENLTVNVCLL